MEATFSDPKRNIAQLGLEPGMHVADFGAGAGYLAVAAAELVAPSGKVYVIDIQQELLTKVTHLAEKHHLNVFVYVHADLEAPNGSTLSNETQDAVIISNLLFQIEHKEAVLTEAYRVVKPGGALLLIDWRESFGGMGPQRDQVLTEVSARSLTEEAGFRFDREIDAGTYHYGLLYIK